MRRQTESIESEQTRNTEKISLRNNIIRGVFKKIEIICKRAIKFLKKISKDVIIPSCKGYHNNSKRII